MTDAQEVHVRSLPNTVTNIAIHLFRLSERIEIIEQMMTTRLDVSEDALVRKLQGLDYVCQSLKDISEAMRLMASGVSSTSQYALKERALVDLKLQCTKDLFLAAQPKMLNDICSGEVDFF